MTIDKETYLLLEENAVSIKRIAEKLERDTMFSTYLRQHIKEFSTGAYTISEYIFFEIATIYHICIGAEKSLKNSVEKLGIIITGLKLYKPKYNLQYEDLVNLNKDENNDILNYFLNYSEKVRQYFQTVSFKDISLKFPQVLQSTNHFLFDEYASVLYRFASLIVKMDKGESKKDGTTLKRIWTLTHSSKEVKNVAASETIEVDSTETLEDILKELNDLIGLEKVKQEVNTLINFIKIQKEREAQALKISTVSYHCVFTGAPGSGKTTVARILARIYRKLGVIKKGHLIETDRAGLVAEYAGQTAVKVDNVVQTALDGILFIDEAYSLIGENHDDYGREAVATLLKRMEDNRDRLVLIVAGYPDEMETFINNNPGFKSRFNRYLHFEDFTDKELLEIYRSLCNRLDYKLTKKASAKLRGIFEKHIAEKDETFGNGRLARNIFEKSIEKQANRLSNSGTKLSKELLITIEVEDIPE